MAGHVVLLRHGRTPLNADGRLRGRLDPDLDDVGRLEAIAAAEGLTRHPVDLIVTSPLARARQTADAVSRAVGVDVLVDERLTDRDYGDLAGARLAEVVTRYGSLDAAPGVEARAEVLRRVWAALQQHGARPGADHVVLVSHDAVITVLLTDLGVDPSTMLIPTGSLSDLVRRDRRWVVDAVGVTPGA